MRLGRGVLRNPFASESSDGSDSGVGGGGVFLAQSGRLCSLLHNPFESSEDDESMRRLQSERPERSVDLEATVAGRGLA